MSRASNKPVVTPATKALDAADIAYEPLPYEHDPKAPSYGAEAATALGLPPETVFKTLVLHVDSSSFGVVCVPVDGQADLKAAAAALGGKKASLAQPTDVQRLTGYVLGGVSPLGMRSNLPIVVDVSAQDHERIHVSGGRRGFDVGLLPADLLRATGATCAAVAR